VAGGRISCDPQPESIRQVMKILLQDTAHGALLTDEQGTGKTATTIVAVYSLRQLVGGYLRILVVGPKNVLADWKKEIVRWQAHPDLVITLKDRHSIDPDTVERGWLLVSYDTVGHYFPSARRSKMRTFDLLIVDESHHLKEPTIKRTNMVYGGVYKRHAGGDEISCNIAAWKNEDQHGQYLTVEVSPEFVPCGPRRRKPGMFDDIFDDDE
jgi:SNF2-related domain